MKCLLNLRVLSSLPIFLLLITSCQKQIKPDRQPDEFAKDNNENNIHGHLKQTKTFSSDVVVSWLNLQLQMQKQPFAA